MAVCSYSGKEIPRGTGKMLVLKDGKVLHFFSNKEFKFYMMKRRAAKQGWTEEARRVKKMRLAASAHDGKEVVEKKKTVKKVSKHALKEKKKLEKLSAKEQRELAKKTKADKKAEQKVDKKASVDKAPQSTSSEASKKVTPDVAVDSKQTQ